MITYQATFNPAKNDGVFGISLVDDPAMEGLFVALKNEKIQLKEIDKEQRILIGLVLEPDKKIYRNQDGQEFNIVFDADTIKELSHHFFKSNYQKNSTIEHQQPIEGVTFVESWIVEDTKIDKSANFGLSYPKGSWIATMKVDSDDVWNNYVKTGKVKGFSVDAMIDLKQINLKNEINMSDKLDSFMKEVKAFLGMEKEIKLGSVVSGDMTIEYEGETLGAGVAAWIMADDGTKVPLPAGDYPTEDGKTIVVTTDGMIAEVKEAAAAMPNEEAQMNDDAQMAEIASAIKSIMIKYSKDAEATDERFKNLEAKLAAQEALITKQAETIVELSKEPAAKPVKAQPSQAVALNKKGRLLEKIRQN